ncbi:hypothetical protein D7S65_04910 [Ralstonia insidiosa]|nr:hypothetical protein [Ralstonia insidiosa]MBA9870022.1 hypothetical protein [Ralstonia insidiosa]MBA9911736.1 hypothetical protein [Ralstonia insidiosa]MBA9939014.1 hypothetical protein [Ralstonia insidiosa]MBA9951264.1 hypothetical protein [Ralstonia insidiosa]
MRSLTRPARSLRCLLCQTRNSPARKPMKPWRQSRPAAVNS